MSEFVLQLLPFVLTSITALVPNDIQRGAIWGLSLLYFGGFVLWLHHPSVRMSKLEKCIDETAQIHTVAFQELKENPRFVAETALRLVQTKLSKSILRSKMLSAKDIAWKEYIQYLRHLSCYIGECQREIQDIQTVILLSLESGRQERYMQDIAQKRTTLNTVFLSSSAVLQDPAQEPA
ncbi:hypothetical protein C8R43DRAFT_1119931 [Mycena crocata]|nr:hypothetical protein C8R43DRAFT_1119931 [Mycena crocata]